MRSDKNITKINNWLSIDKKRFKKSMSITVILIGIGILVYNLNDNKSIDNTNKGNLDALNINENEEFKSAIGNMYIGVTLYSEENNEMIPCFEVLDTGENVNNDGGELIKNGVLVKEISTGDTYWKDVGVMIKNSLSNESYIIKYFVKSDDPSLQ